METKTYEEVLNETGTLYWKTVGVSMQPLIRQERDYICIRKRPEERLKKYDVVLFRRPYVTGRGAYVLHRILKVNPDGTYWIVGDNCISGETVKEENILGILTAMKRKGKNLTMDSTLYWVYVHLWCDCYPLRFLILRCKNLMRRIVRKLLRLLHLR